MAVDSAMVDLFGAPDEIHREIFRRPARISVGCEGLDTAPVILVLPAKGLFSQRRISVMDRDELNTAKEENDTGFDRRLGPCLHAVEWAEHARAYYDDAPCDDGRGAKICGSREEDEPCPL